MTKTLYRSPKNIQIRDGKQSTNRLSLYGTLDSLRHMDSFVEHIPTAKCGCKCPHNGLRLNDAGRRRLADLRDNQGAWKLTSNYCEYERQTERIQDDVLLDNLVEYPAKLRAYARAIAREMDPNIGGTENAEP